MEIREDGAAAAASGRAEEQVHRSSRLRRIGVAIVGGAVVVVGIVLLVLPGPGLLVVVAGLALLASEFDWAKGLLRKTKEKAQASAAKSAESRGSVALTLVGAVLLLVAAGMCFANVDFGIPLVAKVSSPLTGVFLALSGLIVVGLTLWQRHEVVATRKAAA